VRTKLVELTFVHSPLTSTDGSDPAGQAKASSGTDPKPPTPDDVDTLIAAFNTLYGKSAAQRVRGGVLLRGDSRQLGDMTRVIHQFDQPYPQVQLNSPGTPPRQEGWDGQFKFLL
jgi:hypothetical protein